MVSNDYVPMSNEQIEKSIKDRRARFGLDKIPNKKKERLSDYGYSLPEPEIENDNKDDAARP